MTSKAPVKLQDGGQPKRSPAEKERFKMSRTPTIKPNKSKQTPRKKMPNAKPEVSFTPPEVTYSEGIPKDIGFGRGDQQQLTGVWLVSIIKKFLIFFSRLRFTFLKLKATASLVAFWARVEFPLDVWKLKTNARS